MKKVLLLVLLVFACGCSSPEEPQPIDGKSYYEWRATELEYFESFYVYRKEGQYLYRNYTYTGDDIIIPCTVEEYIEYSLQTDVYDKLVDYDSGHWHYHVFVQDYKGDWYSIIMRDNKEITALTKFSQK